MTRTQSLRIARFILDAIVGRQAAFRLAERHAAARHREAHAELARGRDLVIDVAAVLEHIGMVKHRRAAGRRQLGAADQHRGARGLRRPARPDAIVRLEPGKQVGVLRRRQVARKHLVEMVVAVDEARKQDLPGRSRTEVRARRQLGGRSDLLDHAVTCEQAGIPQFAPLVVHRHDHVGILREQCAHLISRTSPSRWRGRRLVRERSRERCEHQGGPDIGSRSAVELMNSRARTGTTDGADRAPMPARHCQGEWS